jgi:UPF0755 protein
MEEDVQLKQIAPSFFVQKVLNIFFVVCFLVIFGYYAFSSPLNANSVRIHVGINSTLTSISDELETRLVVRHSLVLKSLVYVFHGDKKIIRGDYVFLPHTNVLSIAYDIARGHHNVDPIRVTLREGATNDQIVEILSDKLEGFRKDLFLEKAQNMQGKLFPDTYFFYSLSGADEIFLDIQSNFVKRMALIQSSASKHTENEILTMASIIQKEALGESDAKVISGILWKRISLGMPLQVDAYKPTYTVKGLPAMPINNPGFMSIQAAANPVESPYLYYLHDKKGMVHYATTYKEHQHNITQYLK